MHRLVLRAATHLFRTAIPAIVLLAIGAAAPASQPVECVTPVDQHPWGQFKPGSWKRVRVTTELLNSRGEVESQTVTETQTTLESVRDCKFALRIEVTVEIAGKRFVAQPQFVTQGINGEVTGQTASLKTLSPGEITIEGDSIPCEIKQVTIDGEGTRRVSILHYNAAIAPFLLKRVTTATDAVTRQVKYRTEVETVDVEMAVRVRNEILTAAVVKTIHKHEDGKVITTEWHCQQAPGGVVAHSSKELDKSGRVIRRSILELVDYYVAEEKPPEKETKRRGIFRRRDRRN